MSIDDAKCYNAICYTANPAWHTSSDLPALCNESRQASPIWQPLLTKMVPSGRMTVSPICRQAPKFRWIIKVVSEMVQRQHNANKQYQNLT